MTMSLNLRSVDKPDEIYIRTMFDGMASRYGLFSLLIGFGSTPYLRRECLNAVVRPGSAVLDVACGTGDLTFGAMRLSGPQGDVTGLDFSANMINVARRTLDRVHTAADAPTRFIQAKAEDLPLKDKMFDCIVSGFAMRNLYENIEQILAGMYASLNTGGKIGLLDLTKPNNPVLRFIWKVYMFICVGMYGLLLFGKKYPIAYLPDSSDRFLDKAGFVAVLKKHGFKNIKTRSFILGSATLYTAER